MKSNTRLLIGIASACIALGASAQTLGNGGTGYVGLTASATQDRAKDTAWQSARAGAMEHPRAGEASTINDGRPMRRMRATWASGDRATAMRHADLQRMGGSPGGRRLVPGGTPD